MALSTEKYLRRHECPICFDPLLDAVTLEPCTHIFNRACIKNFSACPLCNRRIKQIIPNENIRTRIRLKLEEIITDPFETDDKKDTASQALALFPKQNDDVVIVIETTPLLRSSSAEILSNEQPDESNRMRIQAKKIIIYSLSFFIVLGGIALLCKSVNDNGYPNDLMAIPGVCMIILGCLLPRAAKC